MKPYSRIIIIFVVIFFATPLFLKPALAMEFRIKGDLSAKAYGYQDASEESHLWLFQDTRLALYQIGGPFSFHFSGGYLGDSADDFSHSNKGRFLKGYIQFGGIGHGPKIRLGRFFNVSGVALGTIDGLEISESLSSYSKLTVFTGLMSPLSREFDFSPPEETFAAGGELKLKSKSCPLGWKNTISLSFVMQNREEKSYRKRFGISTYHYINRNWNWLNTVHLRFSESPLRKIVTRLRYHDSVWNAMLEGAIFNPDVADYSWFADFNGGEYGRIRFVLDRCIKDHKWGVGIEGGILLSGDNSGFRGGPVLTIPFGQIGYRYSAGGDMALASGPWVNLRYKIYQGIDIYAYGAMTTYEWEAFDIESDDLMMLHTGATFVPSMSPNAELFGEFQLYQTPQLNQDRRAMAGVRWKFDTRRAGR